MNKAFAKLTSLLAIALALLAVAPKALGALPVESYELRRNQAYKLTDKNSPEAEPALLTLLQERPADGGVLFALGRVALHNARLLEKSDQAVDDPGKHPHGSHHGK